MGVWKRLVKGQCLRSWLGAVGAELRLLGYNVCVYPYFTVG